MKLTIVQPTDHLTIILNQEERLLLTQAIQRVFMRTAESSTYLSDALAATLSPSFTREEIDKFGQRTGIIMTDFKWFPRHIDGVFRVLNTLIEELKFNLELARDEAPSTGGILKELADIEEINKLGKILSRVLNQSDKQGYNPQ